MSPTRNIALYLTVSTIVLTASASVGTGAL